MAMLFVFILYMVILIRRKSIVNYLLALQILSLLSLLLLNKGGDSSNLSDYFHILFTVSILLIIFHPWRMFRKIHQVTADNSKRVNYFTKVILIYSFLSFVVLGITAFAVKSLVVDINAFRYVEGVRGYYLNSILPFHISWYGLASLLVSISWLLIPLHFYHLQERNKILSILSLVFSGNILLFGITIFSRWTLTHYFLIYLVFIHLFRDKLSKKYRIFITSILGLFLLMTFIQITIDRFTDNTKYLNSSVPLESHIQDPALYSTLDYISQWYENSLLVLNRYSGTTFYGQSSLTPLLTVFNMFSPVKWNYEEYLNLKIRLMGSQNYYKFNGLVASWVYDFGYLFTIIIAVLYYKIVAYIKPSEGKISINHLLLIVLVIQLPLFSIFYSTIAGIILPLVIWLPINKYLKSG